MNFADTTKKILDQTPKVHAYVSGPMTGYENFNFDAFNTAEAALRAEGFAVFNPASTPLRDDWQWEDYMRLDLQFVARCDLVFVLPGWQKSRGACIEIANAHWLKKPVFDFETRKEIKITTSLQVSGGESVCAEADRLVSTDRQKSYGHPAIDFARTALIWTGYLLEKLKPGVSITAVDVPCLMIGLKLSRAAQGYKRDTYTDISGYAKTAELVEDYEP